VARTTGLPVLVSGTPNETTAMRVTLARDFGVSTRWIEGESRDHLRERAILGGPFTDHGDQAHHLITSSTHLYRAAQEYRDGRLRRRSCAGRCHGRRAKDRVFRWLPQPDPAAALPFALYELIGEPMRRLQAALGVRERFDRKAAGGTVN